MKQDLSVAPASAPAGTPTTLGAAPAGLAEAMHAQARAQARPEAHAPPPGVKDFLLDHEYDGIREYDNPTPGWWHAIFVATIFFSVLYMAFYHTSPAALSNEELWAKAQRAEYARIFGAIGDLKPDEPTILSMMHNPQMLEVAKGVFEGNCAACHAKDGGGINGPNLTDDSWKNVKDLAGIYQTITTGANKGAMPSWENRLQRNERVIVAAYVASLRGSRPANPKSPEGEPIAPWPTQPH